MSSNENSNDRPITVGVIDDDPMICQAMRLILEDYSAGRLNVVFTCTDGSQAIDETTGHHPDVALMDIAMPGMDGIETTRRLRALPRPPHVLILTSLSPSGTVERAIEAGAEGFVSKTDAPEEIIRRITDVCVGLPQFKCPMITVYMVKPHPHTNSLPSTGRLYFQKSFCNGPSGCSTWPSRR